MEYCWFNRTQFCSCEFDRPNENQRLFLQRQSIRNLVMPMQDIEANPCNFAGNKFNTELSSVSHAKISKSKGKIKLNFIQTVDNGFYRLRIHDSLD